MQDAFRAFRRNMQMNLDRVEGAGRDNASIDYLSLDTRRKDFYYLGPPEAVYCILPNGQSIRVLVTTRGTTTNDVAINPDNWVVAVQGPYWRLPINPLAMSAKGELICLFNGQEGKVEHEQPNTLALLGDQQRVTKFTEASADSARTVTSSDGGFMIYGKDGELVASFHKSQIINTAPTTQMAWFDQQRYGPMLASNFWEIMPPAFVPPLSHPRKSIDTTTLSNLYDITKELKDLLGATEA